MDADKFFILVICLTIFLMAWVGFPDIIKCPYKSATGRPCLFCGTLTSFSLVLHGRIKEAWGINPMGVFVLLGLCSILAFNYLKI